MISEFSEFTYGYALTEEFAVWRNSPLSAAPRFPSLIEEGRSDGGYDVQLDRRGVALFLQFKLSDFMIRRNATGMKRGLFASPYYQFQLRSLRYSKQHNLLLSLENMGREVYYVAPAFHTVNDLNQYYAQHEVMNNSAFFSPTEIGMLDTKDHCVMFQPQDNFGWCLSEPKQIKWLAPEMLVHNLSFRLEQKDLPTIRHTINDLAESMLTLVEKTLSFQMIFQRSTVRDSLAGLAPPQRLRRLSRYYFGCELLFVTEKAE